MMFWICLIIAIVIVYADEIDVMVRKSQGRKKSRQMDADIKQITKDIEELTKSMEEE